jgi:Ca2+-transporting ATPase
MSDDAATSAVAALGDAPDPNTEWYRLPVPEVLARLDVDPLAGLTDTEVADRRARFGANQLDEPPRRPAWLRFVDQFKDLMVYILIGAAVVSALVGDYKDPIVIAIVLLINAVMGFVQENRADNALAALKGMLDTIVRVRRGGAVQEVSATDLVPGDVVLLEAGDRVPADGRFLVTASTSVDESMLTGESVPVDKQDEPVTTGHDGGAEVPLAERFSVGYMNTTLVRGRAELVVTGTGMHSEVGKLAGLLGAAEEKPTPLQEQIEQLGKRLAAIAFVAVIAVFGVALFNGDTISEALLNSVALAVAAIPEGLPAVVTVTLAIGVGRLAKRNAIMKRLASVETLGSTTVICSDKTGTLTLNQMTATRLLTQGGRYQVDGLGYGTVGDLHLEGQDAALGAAELTSLRPALLAGVLCNDAHLRGEGATTELVGDPTEGALIVLAAKAGMDPETTRQELPRIDEVPFDSATKFMATMHHHPEDRNRSLVVVKGAPDVVLARCSSVLGANGVEAIDDTRRAELVASNEDLGSQGLRVLALATIELPVNPNDYEGDLAAELDGLQLVGLVGILDPARPEAIDAIAECRTAGIGVKMITGDHASTAGAIASQLGIQGRVITGAELDRISDEDLPTEIDGIGVCARVSPEHKVRVVKALQSTGNIVAMTGDGVNDAASLKQAEIGVAMGITGTEVTKEAGDMILTDDNFATIVHAVEGGRAIYENIITFVRFQLTTNISAILTILIAQLAQFGSLFNAIQILFVNIIADGPPAIALGVDPPKADVMSRPPRDRDAAILNGPRLARIVVSAVVITIGTLALFMAFKGTDEGSAEWNTALTMAFSSFVFFQLVNSFCVRSGDETVFSRYSLSNRPLLYALGGVIAMQILVVQLPFLQNVFDTVPLTLTEWGWVALTPLSLLVIEELRKVVVRARRHSPAVAAA